jgi:4-hydroxy-tetrahydrodipicolinate reductase
MGRPSYIVVVGYTGRMPKLIQSLLEEQKIAFRVYSSKAPDSIRVSDFKESYGVIDFSDASATGGLLQKAVEAKVAFVCGTTGYAQRAEIEKQFREAAKIIPIVWDSNFSLGIEMLCQLSESALKQTESIRSKTKIAITDIHHIHKKDSPSGTALKIQDRIEKNFKVLTPIESQRIGEVVGEHRVSISFDEETIEIIHKAHSRRPFAAGAISALQWAAKQKPGFYTMKDILK